MRPVTRAAGTVVVLVALLAAALAVASAQTIEQPDQSGRTVYVGPQAGAPYGAGGPQRGGSVSVPVDVSIPRSGTPWDLLLYGILFIVREVGAMQERRERSRASLAAADAAARLALARIERGDWTASTADSGKLTP